MSQHASRSNSPVDKHILISNNDLTDLFKKFLQVHDPKKTVVSDDNEIPSSSSADFGNKNKESDTACANINDSIPVKNNISAMFKAPQPLFNQNPNVWFNILEQQFKIAGIKLEDTMYAHAVSALDSRLHNTFADMILREKGKQPYTIFKNEVLRALGESESARVNNVLHGLSLGDKKPSQLLNEFRLNAGNTFSENALQQLWLKRLPQQIQIILSTFANDVSLTVLAERADKMLEVMGQAQLGAINQATPSKSVSIPASQNLTFLNPQISTNPNSYSDLDAKFDQFRTQILSKISSIYRSGARSTSNSQGGARQSSRSRSRKRCNPKFEECFYHYKYKDKARNCLEGCKHFEQFFKINKKPNF